MIKSLLFLIAALSFSTSHAEIQIEIYGDDGYAPYAFAKKGNMEGIYTEVIKQADQKMAGYNIVLKPIPWKRGLSFLESGKIAFLYPPYYRPEQRPYMTYSTDILDEKLALFCRTDLVDKGLNKFPDDFKGLSIAKILGFSPGKAIDDAAAAGTIKVVEIKASGTILNRLSKGKIDCYINDRVSILTELNSMKEKGKYDGKSITESLTMGTEKGYIGVTKKKEAHPYIDDFITTFNKTIEAMKASGEIEKIISNSK